VGYSSIFGLAAVIVFLIPVLAYRIQIEEKCLPLILRSNGWITANAYSRFSPFMEVRMMIMRGINSDTIILIR
jgi:hypothetical protein